MSKTIRHDALLVRALASELDARLAGARLHAARFLASGWAFRLATGRGTLAWDLHPQAGSVRLLRPGREPGNLPVHAGSRVAAIRSLPDERVLVIEVTGPDGTGAGRIVVEMFGTHANALVIDDAGVIAAALRRGTRSRPAERGMRWTAPDARHRSGIDGPVDPARFRSLLAGGDAAAARRNLLREIAWTSPVNVGAILGGSALVGEEAVQAAYGRYMDVCHGPVSPVLLDLEGVRQPYPRPLPGLAAAPVPDLLTAFARAAADRSAAGDALDVIAARRETLARRRERLRVELEGAASEAAGLRRAADLLLSQARAVRRGQTAARLDDFAGGAVDVELDPALDAAANAERLYQRARRRRRAAERIPRLLHSVEEEDARLAELAAQVRAGDEAAVTRARAALERRAAGTRKPPGERLPYRRYRSRNGLEIRVGRGARANDELTLRHARPEDIWMHARDVAGAHVVLVWGRREQNPSESDLHDAAVLAALHSRARTSAVVPVDWTRRKHVRKPRGSPPGTVILERAKTLFVRPDARLAGHLRRDQP